MLKTFKTKLILFGICSFFLFSASGVLAQTETHLFNIDSHYDLYARKEVEAILVRNTSHLYFYIEKSWWESRSSQEQNDIKINLFNLGEEFKNRIYPVLTSFFGSEPKPGADGDERITVLVHQMNKEMGGYFNPGDVYEKIQYPRSNQKEMVYLNSQYINEPDVKSFLAHEFVHLITANQKNLLRGANEEIWLNEARAEYAPTLLGYDDVYKGSNLEKRTKEFLNKPSVSLTEWLNRREDYGIVNLFVQYLVDHYGVKILSDSLQSNKTGIDSLNYALAKNNYNKDFHQVFADWMVAVLVNDCKIGERYCYLNRHLKDLRIAPVFYHLPKAETVLSTYHPVTHWHPNWHRLIGGAGDLVLEFDGASPTEFRVSYLLCDLKNNCSVGFFSLDKEQKGKVSFSGFGEKYSSLTIMPFLADKISGFNGKEDLFSFSWKVSASDKPAEKTEDELILQLLGQIEELKKQIAYYQAQINILLVARGKKEVISISCQRIDNNLYFGLKNSAEVRCLQEFLRDQGLAIYPEGLVTGNFLSLTQAAVIRFQEKHREEVLTPLSLQNGTGYVGSATRVKINSLISQ